MKNQKDTIKKILGYLNKHDADGGVWLPNIQRPFVWSTDQIERLFDSIMRQYPIGTLLVWRTRSDIKHRRFIDAFHQGLKLSHYTAHSLKPNAVKRLVLDGQQRLQSLFLGLHGAYDRQELYFDVLSGDIVAPEDIRYRFRFLSKDRAKWPYVLFKQIVNTPSLPNRIANEIIEKANAKLTVAETDRIHENVMRARQEFCTDENIAYQELDSLDEPDAYNENDVVEIFIRANSGGTRLGKSDLLFSLLTASWEEADVNLESLLEKLNAGGFQFTRDFILKTCLVLLEKGAKYEVGKFRDEQVRLAIIESWERISNAISAVHDFLLTDTFIRHDKALPSYLALIPLIYFRYHFSDKWKSVSGMADYILRVSLAGTFSGSPDNLIDRCVRAIRDQQGFSFEALQSVIYADGRTLEISSERLLSIGYDSKEIHLLFNIWYGNGKYIPAFKGNEPQIDHIFPQSALKSVKVENPETGRKVMRYHQYQRDQLANCMLLTADENGFQGKSGTLPDEWIDQLPQDKQEAFIDLHLIPRDRSLWQLERFEDFVEARKRLILSKFTNILTKA